MIWEYLVVNISAGVIQKELSEHGQHGWELVQLIVWHSSKIDGVFKRRYEP